MLSNIPIDAVSLAELLLAEMVDSAAEPPATTGRYDPEFTPALREAARLYRYASVVMILLKEERERPQLLQVRAHLEQLWVTSSSVPEERLLDEVRMAMQDLSVLLAFSDSPSLFSWARRWLERLGIQEFNPVRLHLIGTWWMDFFNVVTESLRNFEVVEAKNVDGA